MRTNIAIDDALMKLAMQASGARSKREAVELSLRTHWEGGLEALGLDGQTEAAEQQP